MKSLRLKKVINDLFLSEVVKRLKRQLIREGEIPPKGFFVYHYPDDVNRPFGFIEITMLHNFFRNESGKDQLAGFIQGCWEEIYKDREIQRFNYQLCAVIMISDTWFTEHKGFGKEEFVNKKFTPPSMDIARKEGIIVAYYLHESSFMDYHFYSRQTGQIAFEKEPMYAAEILDRGRFKTLFPKTDENNKHRVFKTETT